ncbi:MAG: hypothetical protein LJE85_03020 [Gammaproteobacteria bacterium]|jgi:hypothetical protein|nr:hypothetical protein [Gammaproteobacteria bacterium]
MNSHSILNDNQPQPLSYFRVAIFFVVIFLATACGKVDEETYSSTQKTPSTEPIKTTIKTTIPVAYAAAIAMQTVECATFPCASTVTVSVEAGALPINLESYGSIVVGGLWSDSTHAVLTTSFIDVSIGAGSLQISNVATFPVLATADGIKLVYAGLDINIDSGETDPAQLSNDQIVSELDRLNTATTNDPEVSVDMDAWVIEVDYNGTSSDHTDDRYLIVSGGAQQISIDSDTTSVYQLGMVATEIGPNCSLNPTSGFALLNEVKVSTGDYADWPVIGSSLFQFDDTCDGTIKVVLSIGTFLGSTGKSIPLYLDEP